MKNPVFLSLLAGAVLLHGCANYGLTSKIDRDCPVPAKDQMNKDGMLILQKGVTLKCQVKNFTHRMSCAEITDGTEDAWVCNNGAKGASFVFDKNGILVNHKIY